MAVGAGQEMPDDDGRLLEYLSCPMHFVPATVWEWWERYSFIQRYPHTQRPFDAVPARERGFDAYYESKLSEFRDLKRRNAGDG